MAFREFITIKDINPCNCGEGCDYKPEYGYFHSACPFSGYDYTPHQVLLITSRCGCMYHSFAKEIIKYVQR